MHLFSLRGKGKSSGMKGTGMTSSMPASDQNIRELLARLTDAEELIKRQRRELHGLATQLAQTQESERAHIARELHDGVGAHLAVLSLNLNMIANQFPEGIPPGVQRLLDRSMELVDSTGNSVREVIAELAALSLTILACSLRCAGMVIG